MPIKQKTSLRLIYKLHSKQIIKAKMNLVLPLETALQEYPDNVVAISESQMLRFIDELNGVENADEEIKTLRRKIRFQKKRPKSSETKTLIREFYKALYSIQFQKDYLCVIMDSIKDYDKINAGFKVNGIEYRRLLGTNGGVKQSTIVYVNKKLYPELKKRIDNGRKMDVPMIPAKLEAYQALCCSASTPLPFPNGIIVIKDCMTKFTDNVIMISDENEGEPTVRYIENYEVEHDASDGFGLMLPSYSRKVNACLAGKDDIVAGINTRYAWNKGMLYTFDFVEFAKVHGTGYTITDVWGAERDIREAEVILTESMLKLWNCYDSWEDYHENCEKNHYQFSAAKATPEKLENVRYTNYQYLQSYNFTDEEILQLCKPTIDEINDVLGLDYRKSLAFLTGFHLNDTNVIHGSYEKYVKALMIDERMINDPFVRKCIWRMINTKINLCKRGAIKVDGNFAMISGDPYALAQNMFGMKVTGLMHAGEIYHKHWMDKGAEYVSCFRSPMSCHNNIRKLKVCSAPAAQHWYQYMDTVAILNCWDTTCDALNGADCDGDTMMVTNNPIILKDTLNSPTIMCIQRKADKKIVTEDDIIAANKLAFNDDIGVVTNYVTSMFDVQAGFDKKSEEYKVLEKRIMCGQLYQQNSIDRIKGIIAKPMPEYWHSMKECMPNDDDDEQSRIVKDFNRRIVAHRKPYFMVYVYPKLKSQNNTYEKENNLGAIMRFQEYGIHGINDLYDYSYKTEDMKNYLEYYERYMPVSHNTCVVNRISWLFEEEFDQYLLKKKEQIPFDYTVLKSGSDYSKLDYQKIDKLYRKYQCDMEAFRKKEKYHKTDLLDWQSEKEKYDDNFRKQCLMICPNEKELCDILLDMCYRNESSKQFAWAICGDVILQNLLEKNNYTISYPMATDTNGEFKYAGEKFMMKQLQLTQEDIDDYTQ